MSVHKLLLVPENRSISLNQQVLSELLTAVKLIGNILPLDGLQAFQAGTRFLQRVTFLGCAPNIQLDPPADINELADVCHSGKLCHIRLVCNHKSLRYRCNTGAVPRCPTCRTIDTQWDNYLENWSSYPEMTIWQCGECQTTSTIHALHFRKQAVFTQDCVEIWGIYPSEAIPGEKLMESLRGLTDCNWHTFYIKD